MLAQKEKRKRTNPRPYLLIIGIILVIAGMVAAVIIGSNQTGEQIGADCIEQTGYQVAIYDGHDVLISDPQTGVLQKPAVNLSRLNIHDMRWSPDGRHILLYASENDPSVDDVYVFSPLGGRLRNLTNGKFPLESSQSVAWSPNGKIIGLLWRDSAEEPILHYQLIDADSGDMIWSVDSEDMFNTAYGNLWQWSPAGNKLALILNQDGFYNLHVYDLLQDSLIPIAQAVSTVPEWSPDSTHLLLIEPQFQIVDATIGQTVRSFQNAVSAQVTSAKWSSDGSQIVYETGNSYSVMNADGSNTQVITAQDRDNLLNVAVFRPDVSGCLANQRVNLISWNPIAVSDLP